MVKCFERSVLQARYDAQRETVDTSDLESKLKNNVDNKCSFPNEIRRSFFTVVGNWFGSETCALLLLLCG